MTPILSHDNPYLTMELFVSTFINKIDNSDLNNMYLKKLKENSRSVSNQAGIGLIDVRRYNQSKFDYNIITDNIGYYLCTGILIPFNI